MSLRQNLFKTIYKFHVYAGLFIAVHFTIFALTGLPSLFKHEILGKNQLRNANAFGEPSGLSNGEPIGSSNGEPIGSTNDTSTVDEKIGVTAANYEVTLQMLRSKYPSDRALALYPDEKDSQILNARLGLNGAFKLHDARKVLIDLKTGEEIKEKAAPTAGFFGWILRLHRELLLGQIGKIYIGIVGIIYVLMLLSGFFIYGKFMKGKSFGDIRKARLPKLVDLHKFVGVLSFGWGLVIGLSGVLLAFNGTLIKIFQYRSLKHLAQQYKAVDAEPVAGALAPLGQVIKAVLRNKAETAISYVSFPGSEYGIPGHYLVLVKGATKLTKRLNELVVVDASTAKISQVLELPFYLKAAILSEPLHFGNYGGIYLKVIWAFFALCSLAVVLFGVFSYFMKRRRNRASATGAAVRAQVKPHIREPFEPSPLLRSVLKNRYLLPTAFFLMSAAAIVSALFASGNTKILAVGVLLIPALVILFGRRDA